MTDREQEIERRLARLEAQFAEVIALKRGPKGERGDPGEQGPRGFVGPRGEPGRAAAEQLALDERPRERRMRIVQNDDGTTDVTVTRG